MTFDGQTYVSAVARSAQIDEADITAIGHASDIDNRADVVDTTVYALQGVEPAQLVVMRSSRAEEGDFIFYWREGTLPPASEEAASESNLAEFVRAVPGLCDYFPEVDCT